MKLQQIRYLLAIVENGFNITLAAENLYTSQPGISKQIRLLEDELGVQLFVRRGKRIETLTTAGQHIIERARRIVQEVDNIRILGRELRGDARGTLRLATTHTQARYVLPAVIRDFRRQHPDVVFDVHQGTSEQLSEMSSAGKADFVIATGGLHRFPELIKLPVYQWDRVLLVPRDHPLAKKAHAPDMTELSRHPLVTYVFSDRPGSSLMKSFRERDLRPDIAFTARDADVIKTYVRMGLGVGLVAVMAVEADNDADLVPIEASHLFPRLTTWIGFRRDGVLRQYQYDFLQGLASHLSPERIEAATQTETQAEVDELFRGVGLPLHAHRPRKLAAGC